jgi:hypothetical protein
MKIFLSIILFTILNCHTEPATKEDRGNILDSTSLVGLILNNSIQATSKSDYIKTYQITDLSISQVAGAGYARFSWTPPKYGYNAIAQIGIDTEPILSDEKCVSQIKTMSGSGIYFYNITKDTDYFMRYTNFYSTLNSTTRIVDDINPRNLYFCARAVITGLTIVNPWNGSNVGINFRSY